MCICAAAASDALVNVCVATSCTVRDGLRKSQVNESFEVFNMMILNRMDIVTQHYTMDLCGVRPRVNYVYEPLLITSISLATIAVSLRFVARFVTKAKLWWDDYANFGAMVRSPPLQQRASKLKSLEDHRYCVYRHSSCG